MLSSFRFLGTSDLQSVAHAGIGGIPSNQLGNWSAGLEEQCKALIQLKRREFADD